jgi:hypothetical protein
MIELIVAVWFAYILFIWSPFLKGKKELVLIGQGDFGAMRLILMKNIISCQIPLGLFFTAITAQEKFKFNTFQKSLAGS